MLAVADPAVAHALRFMWDRLEQDLSVNDVADEVGVNRQKLERAFRAHLHRGVNAELRRKRLEEFSRLLLATDRPIADLAPLTGFRTMAHLHKTFRQVHGMSPRQFRREVRKVADRNGATHAYPDQGLLESSSAQTRPSLRSGSSVHQ